MVALRPALATEADDTAQTLTPGARTLRERARLLAEEGAQDASPAAPAGDEVLLCRLHDERYAIDLALLRAVQPARGLTPIPCTPAFVAGMLNVRGIIVTVLDLSHVLDLGATPPPEEAFALLIDAATGQGQVGLLVHELLGVSRLPLNNLDRALSGNPAVRGIAEGGIIVLDLATLLADGRLDVADEWS